MRLSELEDDAHAIAANFINGNLSDARAELVARGELRAAWLALRVYEVLQVSDHGEPTRWQHMVGTWLENAWRIAR